MSQVDDARERRRAYKRAHYLANRDKALARSKAWLANNRERKRAYDRQRYADDPQAVRDRAAAHYQANREKAIARITKWTAENRDGVTKRKGEWKRKRYRENHQFRLTEILRSRLRAALDGKAKNGSAVALLGCSVEELRDHLERQFTEGMTWDNMGLRGWHIDHVRPLASFDLTKPDEVAAACHYTNLQPLWAFDNLSKGARQNPTLQERAA